jgi:hypothetical protein
VKPKTTQPRTPDKVQERDFFQTPNYATDLVAPFLCPEWVVWECAAGRGKILTRLQHHGIATFGSDLLEGINFLDTQEEPRGFDAIVTNPPFSLKRQFYETCMSYGRPFALLLPMDFCGWILNAMQDPKAQWIAPTRRIDYITPTGKSGGESTAQYHSGWFCYGLNLPRQIHIVELTKAMKENV